MTADGSIVQLLVRHVAPPAVTVVIGGALTYLLFPMLQAGFERTRQRHRRRGELAETIAEGFQHYIAAWRRLRAIARLERSRSLSAEERELKSSFVLQRNETRDALVASLCRCRFYFSEKAWHELDEFMDWDESQASKRLDELPPLEDWRRREERIVRCLKREL
ncbi:MAG TPA: hypothetical protein VJ994_10530 [Paracoccaceae bacterium]|nr:hypothetical protein [Paracoccaceae bacterium]